MDEITAAQAATLTGMSERTIRRKIASGVLPARRLATNRYAIRVADLQMSRPFEALTTRVEAVEHRLDSLEALMRQFLAGSEPDEMSTASTAVPGFSPGFAPVSNVEVQRLFTHLAYETARLVRSIPFPPSPESALSQGTPAPEDSENATSEAVFPERTGS
jgi:excisionase family DNA binding protein